MMLRPVISVVMTVLVLSACSPRTGPAPVELRGPGYGETTPGASSSAINRGGYSTSYAPPPGNAAPISSIQAVPLNEPNDPYAQAAQMQPPQQGMAMNTLGANPMAGSGLQVPPAATVPPTSVPVAAPASSWAAPDSLGSGDFGWPLRGKILAGFGPKPNGQANDGLNIQAPLGTAVFAAKDGTVSYVGNEVRSFGNMVLVKHAGGYFTVYAHLDQINVAKDQAVKKGQPLGTVGQSGGVSEPQLHFEVRRGSNPQDPKKYLGS